MARRTRTAGSARQPRLRPARIHQGLLAVLTAAALTACTSAAAEVPNWQPKPDAPYAAEPDAPGAQQPTPGAPSSPAPAPDGSTPTPGQTAPAQDPNVLATGLTAPVGLVLLPDGTGLVGERTTGRILQVQPEAGQPTPVVQTVPGLDATGDGGLLDLAIAPTYAETGLVYAYVTTATGNAVVTFTLGGPVTPVVSGIPKGATGNSGRIAFDTTGDLLVATGTAGLPADPASLAGKVLRFDDVGRAATGNPMAASAVYSSGLQGAEGLCTAAVVPDGPIDATVLVGVGASGQVQVATPGGTVTGPIATLPAGYSALGGCAVVAARLFVTSLDGQAVLGADLAADGTSIQAGSFEPVMEKTYGRVRTVVPSPDGTLWLTTSNKDGAGTPVPDDDRVVRITPAGGGGGTSKA